MRIPVLELRRIDYGGACVVDEDGSVIVQSMVQTPDRHLRGGDASFPRNYDASLNFAICKLVKDHIEQRWLGGAYDKFLPLKP